MNSTHRVEIVPVKLEPHPNADTLSIVQVFSGYTCCVRTEDWKGRTKGAYIPPDSVVDSTRPEFEFLKGHERIKVKRLRGVISMGLLMPVNEDASIGDDLAEHFGVKHYEPPASLTSGGEAAPAPEGYRPSFDVESFRRYAALFQPNEPVWITEKIHGASARYCWHDGRLHVGSRTEWKKESKGSIWWKAAIDNSDLTDFCEQHPDITVYGEVYGYVQELRYGAQPGEVRFAAFDLLRNGQWIDPVEARELGRALPWVPVIAYGVPYDLDQMLVMAEGESLIPGAKHVREGCVVKPMAERTDPLVGRVCLKIVGNGYLEK